MERLWDREAINLEWMNNGDQDDSKEDEWAGVWMVRTSGGKHCSTSVNRQKAQPRLREEKKYIYIHLIRRVILSFLTVLVTSDTALQTKPAPRASEILCSLKKSACNKQSHLSVTSEKLVWENFLKYHRNDSIQLKWSWIICSTVCENKSRKCSERCNPVKPVWNATKYCVFVHSARISSDYRMC